MGEMGGRRKGQNELGKQALIADQREDAFLKKNGV
jgi:hypothetical protein